MYTPKMLSSIAATSHYEFARNTPCGDYGGGCHANDVNTVGGATGNDEASFNLSTGGLIAIAVVVGVVVILGVTSTVLYFLAKRNNWQVRKTLARASRRFTGRSQTRDTKRHGAARMRSPSRSNRRDVEKGQTAADPSVLEMGARAPRNGGAPPPRYTERP